MHFQTQMEKAFTTLCQLLGSKSISDVNESIEFFVVASEFGLQSAIVGVRRMLVLIWSRDSAVRDAVVEAYKGLYLDPEAPNARYMYEDCFVIKGIREMKRVKLWALCGIFIVVFVFMYFSFEAYNMFYSFVTRFRSKTALIVKNLIALTQGASIGDLTSLEELVGCCVCLHSFPCLIRDEMQRLSVTKGLF